MTNARFHQIKRKEKKKQKFTFNKNKSIGENERLRDRFICFKSNPNSQFNAVFDESLNDIDKPAQVIFKIEIVKNKI